MPLNLGLIEWLLGEDVLVIRMRPQVFSFDDNHSLFYYKSSHLLPFEGSAILHTQVTLLSYICVLVYPWCLTTIVSHLLHIPKYIYTWAWVLEEIFIQITKMYNHIQSWEHCEYQSISSAGILVFKHMDSWMRKPFWNFVCSDSWESWKNKGDMFIIVILQRWLNSSCM